MKIITLYSVVPMRTEPKEQAEMCTQMLFGQTAELITTAGKWSKIQLDSDGYEGWVDSKMVSNLTEEEYVGLQNASKAIVKFPVAMAVSRQNQTTILLTAGTELYNYEQGAFQLLGAHFSIEPSMVQSESIAFSEEAFMQMARFFMNIPYLWGGKSAFGMDCSGFVQVICSLFGVALPRDASQQMAYGEGVDFLVEARMGDVAFFQNSEGKVTHVGILIDAERIMHCSGRVKVDKIDAEGIISPETGEYTHHLKGIRRLINS